MSRNIGSKKTDLDSRLIQSAESLDFQSALRQSAEKAARRLARWLDGPPESESEDIRAINSAITGLGRLMAIYKKLEGENEQQSENRSESDAESRAEADRIARVIEELIAPRTDQHSAGALPE